MRRPATNQHNMTALPSRDPHAAYSRRLAGAPLLAFLLMLSGCEFLSASRYCYCKVESEGCDELSVISDQVENSDQKTVENPGL